MFCPLPRFNTVQSHANDVVTLAQEAVTNPKCWTEASSQLWMPKWCCKQNPDREWERWKSEQIIPCNARCAPSAAVAAQVGDGKLHKAEAGAASSCSLHGRSSLSSAVSESRGRWGRREREEGRAGETCRGREGGETEARGSPLVARDENSRDGFKILIATTPIVKREKCPQCALSHDGKNIHFRVGL